ncbi:hypothetical protein ACFLS9_06215 [Bacteroidota bacterium]
MTNEIIGENNSLQLKIEELSQRVGKEINQIKNSLSELVDDKREIYKTFKEIISEKPEDKDKTDFNILVEEIVTGIQKQINNIKGKL